MSKLNLKRIWSYTSSILLGLIILTLIIPSWRIKFQATVQRFFITSVQLSADQNQLLDFSRENWQIKDHNQIRISFNSLNGKPIILNFWATWCPSCQAELPELKSLQKSLGNEAYVICLTNESYEVIEEANCFSDYGDLIYYTNQFSPQFKFKVYPTTFVLDSDLRIISKTEGAKKFNTVENLNFLRSL